MERVGDGGRRCTGVACRGVARVACPSRLIDDDDDFVEFGDVSEWWLAGARCRDMHG